SSANRFVPRLHCFQITDRSRRLVHSCTSARAFAPRFLPTSPHADTLLSLPLPHVFKRTYTSQLTQSCSAHKKTPRQTSLGGASELNFVVLRVDVVARIDFGRAGGDKHGCRIAASVQDDALPQNFPGQLFGRIAPPVPEPENITLVLDCLGRILAPGPFVAE